MSIHLPRCCVLGCVCCLLLALAVPDANEPLRAEEPKPKPLTVKQQHHVKERNALLKRANTLYRAGKLAEAATEVEKALAIEREVFGSVRAAMAPWLAFLAKLHEAGENFAAARKARQEELAVLTKQYGAKDWRVTDARLDLDDLGRRSKLDTDGRKLMRQATALNKRVFRLWEQGRSREALPLARKALAIRRRLLGKDHRDYAQSLFNLAAQYQALSQFGEAKRHHQQALDLLKKLLTEDHPLYAFSLNNLAMLYQVMGDYARALPLYEKARDLTRKLLTENHPDYANSLNNLALLYKVMGDYARALPLLEKARDLYKKLFTEDHPDYAMSLNNLASLYQAMGDYARALPLFQKASGLNKKLLTENHPDYATSLNNLGMLYQAIGDYTKALPLLEKARDLRKKLVTEDHPDYATSLNNLGMLYQAIGDYTKALPLLEKARSLRKKLLTEDHPDYATSLNNLASLYQAMGDYARALPLFQKARGLYKKLLTENHPDYANSLNNLASLYQAMGDYARALPLDEKARDLRKKLLTENHPQYANSLQSLATLYQDMGDYARALPLMEKARDLRKKLLTENHPSYANSLNNLASLYQDMGDYPSALSLYQKARDLRKKLLTENHPHYATSLNNLAELYMTMGNYARALPLFEKARALYKQLLTENHPDYATSLNNLALLHQARGQPSRALPLLRRALTVQRASLDNTFAAQNDRQRLMLLRRLQVYLHAYLSVASGDAHTADRGYPFVLAWKGAVTARQGEERLARDRPDLRLLAERLRLARAGLARLARTLPTSKEQRADWLQHFDRQEKEKERLQTQLAQKSAAYRRFRQLDKATVQQVADTLPPKTALIDFLEYTHFSPPPQRKGRLPRERRLLAFVLVRGRQVVCVPLGPAQAIDRAVHSWRQAVVKYQDASATGATLSRLVWQPLRKHLAGATTVLIAPDGVLCGLPFAALPGQARGSYLLEEVALGYVTSGRHLLEQTVPTRQPSSQGTLVLGDPAYGDRQARPSAARKPRYPGLPGTRLEAERIVAAFRRAFPRAGKPLLLAGTDASATTVKKELMPSAKSARWRYLHLATHGFFEAALPGTPSRNANGALPFRLEREYRTLERNPLLRSGLALAGANRSPDGILTAEEVADLDLRGCELAVLSACDTGLGRVDSGEGVQGLQRAFQAAGARTLVASLWKVNDAATSLLMEEFYANLWTKKLSRLEALRQAQLTVLRHPERVRQRQKALGVLLAKRGLRAPEENAVPLPKGGKVAPRRSPPALWAAFVLSGDTGKISDAAGVEGQTGQKPKK